MIIVLGLIVNIVGVGGPVRPFNEHWNHHSWS